jgi:hypothetical protein
MLAMPCRPSFDPFGRISQRSELGRLGRTSHFPYTLAYSPSQASIALIHHPSPGHSRSYRPCQKIPFPSFGRLGLARDYSHLLTSGTGGADV